MTAAVQTISRAPVKSNAAETIVTPIQESSGERSTFAPRLTPRHDAQCQMPSHCVEHP